MHVRPHLVRRCVLILLVGGGACGKTDEAPSLERSQGNESTESMTPAPQPERMTLEKMDRVIRAIGANVEQKGSAWGFEYLETPVVVITDPVANRMRVVAEVIDASEVTGEQWAAIMVANFHTALDARYAVSNGVVYTLFLHPLGSLTEGDLRSAVSQVVVLSKTFGSTYNSTGISFGREAPAGPEPEQDTTPPSL